MNINKVIIETLKQFKIDKSQGILFLLGLYYELEVEKMCSEEVIKAINLTKIVDKDYSTNTIRWNIPLFDGQEIHWDWVAVWMDIFSAKNPDRRGSLKDAKTRMKAWFADNPEYRKEDVIAATNLYMKTLTSAKYCMHSHKFIYDGAGVLKKSTLLQYCERLKTSGDIQAVGQIGKVIS